MKSKSLYAFFLEFPDKDWTVLDINNNVIPTEHLVFFMEVKIVDFDRVCGSVTIDEKYLPFTLSAVKNERVVYTETKPCITVYDWANFNVEFRRKLEVKGIVYDYIVCDDDYKLFDELERKEK